MNIVLQQLNEPEFTTLMVGADKLEDDGLDAFAEAFRWIATWGYRPTFSRPVVKFVWTRFSFEKLEAGRPGYWYLRCLLQALSHTRFDTKLEAYVALARLRVQWASVVDFRRHYYELMETRQLKLMSVEQQLRSL